MSDRLTDKLQELLELPFATKRIRDSPVDHLLDPDGAPVGVPLGVARGGHGPRLGSDSPGWRSGPTHLT